MYQSKFIQLLAVISLTTIITACGDKPSEQEETQAPQTEQQTSVAVNPEELNIPKYNAETQTDNTENNASADTANSGNDKLQEEIKKLEKEMQKVAEEIEPNTETTKASEEIQPSKESEQVTEVANNEPSSNDMQADEEELSELEKEAMAMADDVNE